MVNRLLFRQDTATDWVSKNPILGPSEPGVELGTNRMKLGDGIHRWLELPYFVDDVEVRRLIAAAVGSGGGGSDGGAGLAAHIASLTPHPVYDDALSLLNLYENAKV